MTQNADKGSLVTVDNDSRVTRVGKFIRKFRLDELCQLIDVFRGTMTFVGTRPEVPKYVEKYTDEMKATLLLPAGVTSIASIKYKDEARLLNGAEDTDKVYVETILPEKMKYNLEEIRNYGFFRDIKTMFQTVFAVFGGDKAENKTEKENETAKTEENDAETNGKSEEETSGGQKEEVTENNRNNSEA